MCISFPFIEFITNSGVRCLGHLPATIIEHLLILYITNAWQKCWHRAIEKVYGFDHWIDGRTKVAKQRGK